MTPKTVTCKQCFCLRNICISAVRPMKHWRADKLKGHTSNIKGIFFCYHDRRKRGVELFRSSNSALFFQQLPLHSAHIPTALKYFRYGQVPYGLLQYNQFQRDRILTNMFEMLFKKRLFYCIKQNCFSLPLTK